MLITWGTNDVFFTVEGATAYLRDLPDAELHLIDTGHFALEDQLFLYRGAHHDVLCVALNRGA